MSNLYIMVGVPGSGKSTWAKAHKGNMTYVSRDEIRFSMVAEDEEYFAKETVVFTEYCRRINEALSKGENVLADATHLNRVSRRKLLNNIKGYEELHAIVMMTDCAESISRNENRVGTRAFVPHSVIRRMANQFEMPEISEGFKQILIIYPQDSKFSNELIKEEF